MSENLSLDKLSEQQEAAIEYMEGPVLVLAGAGCGKTQLITHKYARLYNKDREKYSTMLAVALTNKAADEMRDRIAYAIGSDPSNNLKGMWVGTFYSQCNRILLKEKAAIGITGDYVIYDSEDQCRLIRHILNDMKLYEALYKGVASKISYFKSSLLTPDELFSTYNNFDFDEKLLKVYVRYQDEMRRTNALDYDDLISYTIRLFEENPDILNKYREIFSYILVDEFQDTSYAQYQFLKLLATNNILVAGDDDQTIYKSRDFESENILAKFEADFDNARLMRLEQSFRCTQNILKVSGSVISKNTYRKQKILWTDKQSGEKVCHYWFMAEEDEAKYIAKNIKDLYLKGNYAYSDIAILYRVNLQSRVIEEALKNERIPFKVIGSSMIYHKRETKDLISYLRLMWNKDDNVSIRWIINQPNRGITVNTLNKIENEAKKEGISIYKAIVKLCAAKGLSTSVKEKLNNFIALLDLLSENKSITLSEAIKLVGTHTSYIEALDENALNDISEIMFRSGNLPLGEFLSDVSLTTTNDDVRGMSCVSLMTLYNVKGMEFPVVFISGLEDGLIPYFKATETSEELDEERRLFYLGMTRARDILFMTGAKKRRLYAKFQNQEPSRFLKDIPKDCCLWIEKNAIPANVASKAQPQPQQPVEFPYNTGCRVKHPKWGVGVIRDCYGEKNDIKVTVNFPNVGVKRLALKYANLEKI
ncbi:DUF3553 domain-containing protein [Candidatus Magnetominusculus xianensis]|uniref:DNA 3'-5' helicase n=1 Tax=Candidatus Magnetominusculus xianensis TaxID=1748249 RepID=A0ABR5SIT8_9BACT|nr:DUF3553 domain-containing protein [Candidatus Magnetominusculus xianensis]KWT91661.1 ATP-dependent DNA helicase PcrA [Candidatus Magnetominusculus xianensis]MBF0404582.1 DUF3553 domain-containing protein [Nitrospirota bacterium]